MNRTKIKKLIVTNLVIVIIAIVCFSEGFLGLSIRNSSILSASASVAVFVTLVASFGILNYQILFVKEKARLIKFKENQKGEVFDAFEERKNGMFRAEIKTAMIQYSRADEIEERLDSILSQKFMKGSISYNKFMDVAIGSRTAIIKNITNIANLMLVFDEDEYNRINKKNRFDGMNGYKKDDIPDDIKHRKLELYNGTIHDIQVMLRSNEELLLKSDELVINLSKSEFSSDKEDAAIEEINQLIHQIQYYKN